MTRLALLAALLWGAVSLACTGGDDSSPCNMPFAQVGHCLNGACVMQNNIVTGYEIPGTGTISTVSSAVTGTGTYFPEELHLGDMVIVGAQHATITAIGSDTSMTVRPGFAPDVSGAAFTFRRPFALYATPINVNAVTITDIMDGLGNVGIGRPDTLAALGVSLPKPPSVSSGNGISQRLLLFDASAGGSDSAGGDTSAVGATAGKGASSWLGTGAGGVATGTGGIGGDAGELDLEASPGGTGVARGGGGGHVVVNPGTGGNGAIVGGSGVLFVNQFGQPECYGGAATNLSDCTLTIDGNGNLTKIKNVPVAAMWNVVALSQASCGGL